MSSIAKRFAEALLIVLLVVVVYGVLGVVQRYRAATVEHLRFHQALINFYNEARSENGQQTEEAETAP